jgi:hypothetical protein
MIIWSGWGFVVVIIGIAAFVVAIVVFPNHELLAIVLGTLLAAGGNYGFARILGRKPDRVLIDPATNERVILQRGDSLCFIPVRFWTWIFVALGVALFVSTIFKK